MKDFVHVSTLLHAVLSCEVFVEVWIERDDVHAEGFCANGDFLTDAAETENTDGLAHDFVSDGLLPASDPVTVLHSDSVGLNVFGDSKKEAESVLSDGGVVYSGSEENGDFFLGRVVDVDLVEADSILGNGLQTGEGLVDDGSGNGVVTTEKRVKFASELEHLFLGKRAASADDFPVLGVKEILVGSRSILE